MSHRCRARADVIPGKSQRGASIVEYALALSALVVVSLGAIDALETSASNEVANQADCVSTRPPPPSCQVRAVVTTTSTSAVPPSSTTTAPPPPAADAAWTDTNVTGTSASWAAHTTFTFDAAGSPPTPVQGVRVRVRVTINNPPSGSPFFASCTTAADGRCQLDFDVPIAGTTQITFHVEDVTLPDEQGGYDFTFPPDVVFTAP